MLSISASCWHGHDFEKKIMIHLEQEARALNLGDPVPDELAVNFSNYLRFESLDLPLDYI